MSHIMPSKPPRGWRDDGVGNWWPWRKHKRYLRKQMLANQAVLRSSPK